MFGSFLKMASTPNFWSLINFLFALLTDVDFRRLQAMLEKTLCGSNKTKKKKHVLQHKNVNAVYKKSYLLLNVFAFSAHLLSKCCRMFPDIIPSLFYFCKVHFL